MVRNGEFKSLKQFLDSFGAKNRADGADAVGVGSRMKMGWSRDFCTASSGYFCMTRFSRIKGVD